MHVQTRWWVGGLIIALAAAGWFGWRQAQWRQAFYVETTGQLIYQLDMAERNLVRARESGDRQVKLDAMATAHGFLVTAHLEANALMKQMAPFRKGKPVYMPSHAAMDLIQYARNLSPDLPDAAVARRIELLDGLGKALAAGLPGKAGEPGQTFTVDPFGVNFDLSGLRESLSEFFEAQIKPGDYTRMPRFEDELNKPTITASQQSSNVVLRVEWERTYKLFPHYWEGYMLLVRPAAAGPLTVSSDAGTQQRMGTGAFEPAETETVTADQHEAFKDRLPPGWTAGSYTVIRLPDGLPQTLTLRGAQGELYWLRPRSGEKAVQLPVAP